MKIISLVGARPNFMKIACCGAEWETGRRRDREKEGLRDREMERLRD